MGWKHWGSRWPWSESAKALRSFLSDAVSEQRYTFSSGDRHELVFWNSCSSSEEIDRFAVGNHYGTGVDRERRSAPGKLEVHKR
jgi:hypothetical protein